MPARRNFTGCPIIISTIYFKGVDHEDELQIICLDCGNPADFRCGGGSQRDAAGETNESSLGLLHTNLPVRKNRAFLRTSGKGSCTGRQLYFH